MFEQKFNLFLSKQKEEAKGQRQEMLKRDLTGTKLLLEKVILPVLGTFDGLTLEKDMIGLSGVTILWRRRLFAVSHYF